MQCFAQKIELDTLRFFSADDVRKAGISLDVGETHEAVREAWRGMREGIAYGGKSVLSIREDDLWNMAEFGRYKHEITDERLGWKLSSLYSVNKQYGAVKIIGANAFNRHFGLPRSTSTILLLDKITMLPLCILEGTEISSSRTGTYASTVIDLFMRERSNFKVFVFGAGPIAQSIIESINYSSKEVVSQIFVKSRKFESAKKLIAKYSSKISIPLEAVSDNTKLRDCAFVVTASNANAPLFDDSEIKNNAVLLHLGGDEVPEAYLKRVIKTGHVFCDDIKMVSRRNSQSLALYFTRKESCLETVGPMLSITNIYEIPKNYIHPSDQPLHINCVGLPVLDLYVTKCIYEKYIKGRSHAMSPVAAFRRLS